MTPKTSPALLLLASISLRAAAFQLPPPSCLPRAVGSCPTPAQAEPRALVCPRAADAAVSSQIGRSKRRGEMLLLATSVGGKEYQPEVVKEAIGRCRDAVARKPENEEAWFLLGVMLQETGDLTGAEEAFQQSTQLDPMREGGWLNLGLLMERKGDSPKALQAYMKALQANPASSAAYVRLGGVMETGGKPEAAEAAYEKALALNMAEVAAHTALCRLLLRLDRPDSARQAAQRAVDAVPQEAMIHVQLGAALNALTRPREAERCLRTALSLDAASSEAHNNLGIALKAQGKYAEAEAAYKSAIELAPGLVEPLYNLGIFYREQGPLYHDKAEEALTKALALDPTNMDIRLVLAVMQGGSSDVDLPRTYIEALFDSVAEVYEDTIIPAIAYNVPTELVAAITKSLGIDCGCASAQLPANEWAILDVGCGTGLSAAPLRGAALVMAGCDVSENMCQVARRKGLYATVAHADAAGFLRSNGAHSADLVVAGDVVPFIKDLAPLFAAAAHVLKPGARFAFTTEEDMQEEGGEEAMLPMLNSKARFCHAEAYVRREAEALGLSVLVADGVTLHKQARDAKVVPGRVYVLQTPAAAA